jgi:CheY-like chemotaxis protein
MDYKIEIAIADDDTDDHFFFAEAVSNAAVPCNIRQLFNGRELIDHLQSAGNKPDMIVLDLNMPVMDGLTTLSKIKSTSELRAIPVFVLTTSVREADRRRCRELGCVEYYVKPSGLAEYKGIIQDIFQKFSRS